MNNLVCFRHPHYEGDSPPDLGCKLCCSKYISALREAQNKRGANLINPAKCLASKKRPPRRNFTRSAKN